MINKPYLLALNRISSIGPVTIKKFLARWPSLEDLFKLSQAELEEAGLTPSIAMSIKTFDFVNLEADLHWERSSENHHLLTWEDNAYPYLLKEIHDPPPVIYAVGDLACLQQSTLAMVGSRKPSVTGAETAWRFAHDLSAHPITIVSGLALGIDAQSHQGCLAANGTTIAVMGTGIDCIYPYRHQGLARKIKEKGLIITEFPLKSLPNAGHFPRRNRIISGLSLSTLVVEAAIRSGSLITARYALEQNRDVLAIPGSIHNPQAQGCHHLLQQGAKLVTSIQDVLDELRIVSPSICIDEPSQSLATSHKNLVKCVGFEITTFDQIIQRSGLSIEKVACDLAELEIQGMVKAIPGGYTRCSPGSER